jgi:hypothetical protein
VQKPHSPGPPPFATIQAKDQRVGDLIIYDDEYQLTVVIGHLHHEHFSIHDYDNLPPTECLRLAAHAAADFVNDLMNDRICLIAEFKGDLCIGSTHFYVDEEEPGFSGMIRFFNNGGGEGEARSQRYLWSGPID